ncbi:hypothetical protein RUM43_001915 [Polyplax serrata]|uniref:C2 domain-containing protein n=1 Tax=Polyplax serrata TaxID=468196 RepID=A0AAN8SKH2_POLSC
MQVSGRVQIQVFYNDERKELSVAVLAADDLACHEDVGFGSQPEAYAQLRLLPLLSEQHCVKTDVAEPTTNPMWNATLEFSNVPGEDLMDRTIEVTLWDYNTDRDPMFLGECTVDLKKAFLDDRPVWYRLEDPKQLRMGDKSPFVSPRGSLANEIALRKMRRNDFALSRSFSDDRDSEGSIEFNFLHPDHAWASCGSRRGSSQSEGHLEPEAVYQLGQDYSRSLPGSRRSSFHSQQGEQRDEGPPPQIYVNKGRRRSSVVRQDPEEILRSLKACKGDMLNRQMSLSGNEKRVLATHRRYSLQTGCLTTNNKAWNSKLADFENRGLRASCQPVSRKDSAVPYPESAICSSSSPEDDNDDDKSSNEEIIKLGPGQIGPKGHRRMLTCGEVKLGLLMTKGQLEVEVVSARNVLGSTKEASPDTYIKTYLKDNDRSLQKRKTKVVSHSCNPVFRQTLKYSACDIFGRSLMVMLWERQKGFDHNQGLGVAELALDKLQLTQLTIGWYPLFPIQKSDSDNYNSP